MYGNRSCAIKPPILHTWGGVGIPVGLEFTHARPVVLPSQPRMGPHRLRRPGCAKRREVPPCLLILAFPDPCRPTGESCGTHISNRAAILRGTQTRGAIDLGECGCPPQGCLPQPERSAPAGLVEPYCVAYRTSQGGGTSKGRKAGITGGFFIRGRFGNHTEPPGVFFTGFDMRGRRQHAHVPGSHQGAL